MSTSHSAGFLLGQRVTREQETFFQRNGYIQFKQFLNADQLADIIHEIRSVQRYLISNNIDKVNGIPLKFGRDTDGSLMIQRIAFASQYSQVLSNLLKDPRFTSITQLLQPYQGRIGEFEKDGLVVNHYVNHENSAFNRMGWHTDSPRDLFLGSRILPMLNVGLHLDDCPFENGGLRVLAGTHKQGLFRLLFRKKYFIDNNPDKEETGFNIQAGDLTIHDGRLWHRVQQSPFEGEASRRRVMYIPIVTGAYQPKHADSATPFYHKLAALQKNRKTKINWSPAEGQAAIAQNNIA